MNCSVCGVDIPSARLRALPNTRYCVRCSSTPMLAESGPQIAYDAYSTLSRDRIEAITEATVAQVQASEQAMMARADSSAYRIIENLEESPIETEP